MVSIRRAVRGSSSSAEQIGARLLNHRAAGDPFSWAASELADRTIVVPTQERGTKYGDIVLDRTASSVAYHLAKRVMVERQWADGLTAETYLADLTAVVLDPASVVVLYRRRGEHIAAFLGPNLIVSERLGEMAEARILVVYSADYGKIITGYQTGLSVSRLVPKGAIWLQT